MTDGSSSNNAYIVKITNSGDNWSIIYFTNARFNNIQFINLNTGFVSAYVNKLYKTTNSGENWFTINLPGDLYSDGMCVLNEDTIWLVQTEDLVGGVFRTTNGGVSWQQQFSGGFTNPDHIYFYNRDIGFMSNTSSGTLFRTTNSGINWTQLSGGPFTDIYFIDSLTGWKSGVPGGGFGFRNTTNGGLTWTDQSLPQGGNIIVSQIITFSNINNDTLWAVGGSVLLPNGFRGILYRTTNQGQNWYYQVPDTSIRIGSYEYCSFNNKRNGWAYRISPTGIHTKSGGDSVFTDIKNNNVFIPENFILHQNYLNPFNPNTIINYEIPASPALVSPKAEGGRITFARTGGNFVSLKVYDINGREIHTIVNKKQNAGKYQIEFDGSALLSGIYFYSLFIDEVRVDTKKMILVR